MSSSSFTSALEAMFFAGGVFGLALGVVLGVVVGRRRRDRFDQRVDQALAVAAPRPQRGRPLSRRDRAEARRLLDEV